MGRLLAALLALGFCAVFAVTQAAAQERQRLGYGLLITNDALGDGYDRWRTGSFASSIKFGPSVQGGLPETFGSVLELRFNGEVIAPANLATPAPLDRRYAQQLSLGLHTHLQRGGFEYAVGADLVFTGPMVGLDHVQESLHDVLGGRDASPAVKAAQVGDDVIPAVVLEAGRSFTLGERARLRPFLEARAGPETLVRVGADFTLGHFGTDSLLVRAPVTGHRFAVADEAAYGGLSLVLGADVAHVADSAYLPNTGPVSLEQTRTRARAGMHWRGTGGSSLFYGVTWLDEEFSTQPEGQVLGSVQFRISF